MQDNYVQMICLWRTATDGQLTQELSNHMSPIYFSEPDQGVCSLVQNKEMERSLYHQVQSAEAIIFFRNR